MFLVATEQPEIPQTEKSFTMVLRVPTESRPPSEQPEISETMVVSTADVSAVLQIADYIDWWSLLNSQSYEIQVAYFYNMLTILSIVGR